MHDQYIFHTYFFQSLLLHNSNYLQKPNIMHYGHYYQFDYTFFTEKWDTYLLIFIYKIISLYK
jgi:hypothetical protein